MTMHSTQWINRNKIKYNEDVFVKYGNVKAQTVVQTVGLRFLMTMLLS